MSGLEIALGVAGGLVLARGAEIVMVSLAKAHERRKLLEGVEEAATNFIDEMHKDHVARQEAEAAKATRRRKPATKKAPVKKPVATTKKNVTTKKGK